MQQSPRAAVVGCVFQVRVVKKVVFLVPHRCLAADHHKAVAAFHAAHLVRGHQLAPRDLIAVAGRAVAALADALPLGADGLLAQQLGNVLKGAVIVAAKVNKTVAVADDRFPVVLVFAFDLGNILQNDIAAYVAAARNGKDLYKVLRRGDMALWDIKGKMAGMPLYQLFGGKCRAAIPCYTHAEGDSVDVVLERVAALKELGYRKIRVQVGGYGGKNPSMHRPENSPPGAYFDPKSYIRNVLNLMEILHVKYGGELEFCHDTHERLSPIDAVNFAKELEPYHLLFLEDALPPEQSDWFRILRQQCATPLAMGELFNNPQEWKHLVQEHLIDYIRIHVSQIGGITPARKVIAFCDAYGVRTAWHGPIDMTPIGHAVNAHLDISCPNLGVQEWTDGLSGLYPTLNGRLMQEIFPGMPERRDGYLYLNDKPGIGVDINEELAARYPCKNTGVSWNWMLARLPDGTAVRP